MSIIHFHFALDLKVLLGITMRHWARLFKVQSWSTVALILTSKVSWMYHQSSECRVDLLRVHSYVYVLYCVVSGDVALTKYCEITLNEDKMNALVYAVKNHYWYQMYMDDLPIWGMYMLRPSKLYFASSMSPLLVGNFPTGVQTVVFPFTGFRDSR